jgi:hypothetical protein
MFKMHIFTTSLTNASIKPSSRVLTVSESLSALHNIRYTSLGFRIVNSPRTVTELRELKRKRQKVSFKDSAIHDSGQGKIELWDGIEIIALAM